tara:strand:+ start:384 stop:953 length:570 start_codon:yes stop_codon:yes gene_type:complete
MSEINESEPIDIPDEVADESVTKPKKKRNYDFTPARKAALERAHAARAAKAEERKKIKHETEKKALEIVEERRLNTTADDDKLDHVLYELDKIKKHLPAKNKVSPSLTETESEYEIPKNLRPPPLRRARKKLPPPPVETESEYTETDYTETEEEPEPLPPPRKSKSIRRIQPVEKSEDYAPPKINIRFG